MVGESCVGVAIATFTASRTPGAAERATATTLAGQCAQAMHRAGLLAAERRARRSADWASPGRSRALRGDAPGRRRRAHGFGQARALSATAARSSCTAPAGWRWPVATGRVARCPQPPPTTTRSPAPSAPAIHSGRPSPLAVPLPLSDRAIGAVGLWFADGPPDFDDDERAAFVTASSQCAQALDRARLHQAEHEVAEVLQRSLLPAGLPPAGAARRRRPLHPGDGARALRRRLVRHAPGRRHDGRARRGRRRRPPRPPAAAVMGQLRSVLAAQLIEGSSPAAALERLDRFAARVAGAVGSTCACLLYDWSTGVLRWALAGHPPVLLVDGPGTGFLDGPGAGAVLGVRGRPPLRRGQHDRHPRLVDRALHRRPRGAPRRGPRHGPAAARGRRRRAIAPGPGRAGGGAGRRRRLAIPGRPTTSRCWWCAPSPRRSKGGCPHAEESMRVLSRTMAGWEADGRADARARPRPGAGPRRGRGERRRARLRGP